MRLAQRHTVEVATTTALDYWTWANHFPAGATEVDGLAVRRFPVAKGRSPDFKALETHVLTQAHTLADEQAWLAAQGPHAPELLDHLHDHGRDYDAVLFYTYIYEPTAAGLAIVPERAALVSTAHDEAAIRLAPYQALFQMPRAFGFLTPEERDLVQGRFRNAHIPYELLGIGLAPAPEHDEGYRARFADGPVVAYLGQVSEGKGVDELLALWDAYRAKGGEGTLALAGTVRMSVPKRDDIAVLGRVSEDDKWALLAAADALVLPSRFESLGIVLLESWQVGTPVLVPRANAVTSGQVKRSGGGLAYQEETFDAALATLLGDREAIGLRGREWVRAQCSWAAFDARLERLVALAASPAAVIGVPA
ncbi:MAG TPA: glycosyltransferase family 4 protein [Candidatus Limnocylindria bacterium]